MENKTWIFSTSLIDTMAENSFWENRYSENDTVYGTQPNEYLKEKIDSLPCGSILFPAEGEGRNAIYAALQGWDVSAYDFSPMAREKAMKNAEASGAHIQYDVAESNTYMPQKNFDAIALIYAHLPEKEAKALHQKAMSWLKPDGHIIIEGFSKDQLKYNSGGPKDLSMLYDVDELKITFEGFQVIEAKHIETSLDEGPYHQGKASVVRFFAQKPI